MKYKILNSKSTNKALLLHGLYASSGYWLEYLKYFKNYKLLIFDIDYLRDLNIQNYIDEIKLVVQKEFDSHIDIVISHSFGTLIANGLPDSFFKHSFEICPVHSSKRVCLEEFISEIYSRLNKAISCEDIKKQFELVDNIIFFHQQLLKPSDNRVLFYPSYDKYFQYDANSIYKIKNFKGDHFNIEEALTVILTN
jgi:hypothetical protein